MNVKDESWFGRTARSAFSKLRKLIVFPLVAVVILGNIWPKLLPGGLERQIGAQLAILGVLLGIILQLVFEIHALTEKAALMRKPQRFPEGMPEAKESIKECLRKVLKQKKDIEIQWMGMTMYNVWANNLEDILRQLDSEIGNRKVTLEVAMSDGQWLDTNKINSRWTSKQAQEYEDRIREYGETVGAGRGWVFQVRRYSHMPMLHGGLINGKYLFLGISRWEEGTLRAGDRLFELYRLEDGEEANDKIKVFQDWFNFSFDPKPSWYAKSDPMGIASPAHGTSRGSTL